MNDFAYIFSNTFFWYILGILIWIAGMIANSRVKKLYEKYSNINTPYSDEQLVRVMLSENNSSVSTIYRSNELLSDNYNPTNDSITLSSGNYNSHSISAIAVSLHETGHAVQYDTNYFPMILRNKIVYPIAKFGNIAGYILIFIGFIMSSSLLVNIALLCIFASVLFKFVTLPVEFDASRRAIRFLKEHHICDEEIGKAKRILTAAAMTYIASAMADIAYFIRILLISRRRD